MKKIRKAIIPAAGLGTRVLPASKAVPKEMLNIVDKPAIQYIVEEAFNSGIEEVLIITNRGKGAIEDHFDHAFELETKLEGKADKKDILDSVKQCSKFGNIYFLRQKETGGLGHAVLCAKSFVGNEPFAVLYGDDVIISENPVTKQLIDAYNKYSKCAVGVKEVPTENVMKYCSLAVEHLEGNNYNLTLLSQAAGMFLQSSATLSLHNPVMIPISFLLNIYCPFSRQMKLAICSISAFVLFIIRTPFREYSKTLIFCEKHP